MKFNSTFDNIYLVNLERSKLELYQASLQLYRHGVKFERWEAIDGYSAENITNFEQYLKRPTGELKRFPQFRERELQRGSTFVESVGAIGYIKTYISIFEDAKKRNFKKIFIIEDDAILDLNFNKKFDEFISVVGDNWKVLMLGASQYNWDSVPENAENSGYYYPKLMDTCGSFAIALDADILDELTEMLQHYESPFDLLPMGHLYEKYYGECFVAYPNIVIPDVRTSSMRGGRDQYSHGERMKWKMENFDFPLPKPRVNVIVNSPVNIKYINSFSGISDQVLEIRYFFNSCNGVRPTHGKLLHDLKQGDLDCLPECELTINCPEKLCLTEEYIIECWEEMLAKDEIKCDRYQEKKAKNKNRVSIIIPTYKRPDNLHSAIHSVASQDYADKEIIIVDDNGEGSEYCLQTERVVNQARAEFPDCDIRYIRHLSNLKGAAARNTGILGSTGEYIAFLDDDDIFLPGRLSKSIEVLQKSDNSVGAVYCGYLGWNSPQDDESRYKQGNLTEQLLTLNYKSHYFHTTTATYKRYAIESINGFNEDYSRHQDLEFNLRFFEKYTVKVVKEALVRLNPAPSGVDNKVYNLDMLKLKRKFLKDFEKTINKFPEELRREIYGKHWKECYNYIKDKEKMLEHFADLYMEGPVQLLLEHQERLQLESGSDKEQETLSEESKIIQTKINLSLPQRCRRIYQKPKEVLIRLLRS